MMAKSYVDVTDLFCGAGGSSQGAAEAGAEIRTALNHWRLAIKTHNTNFPNTDHDCTDISAVEPRRYPRTAILIASPECVNHSLAKGVKRKQRQLSLLDNGQPDPAAERSRATMWDVCRFTEYHRYEAIIVENVPDARQWELWDAWIMAMTLLGYDYKVVYFNSMFAHPTPQSRNRMYVVFWRRGNRAPDLNFHPPAWCDRCEQQVGGVQSWKNLKKQWGKYREQYVYRCPRCAEEVKPSFYPAWTAIDWTIPAQRIGARKRPLAAKTMERIEFGIKKFSREVQPFLTSANHSDLRAVSVHQPHPTQTASWRYALVDPFLVGITRSHEPHPRRSTVVTDPMPAQTAQAEVGLCMPPFVAELRNNMGARGVDDALSTMCASGGHHGVVTPPGWIVANYSPGYVRGVDSPLGTVTTSDHHALLTAPWLTSYYSNDGGHGVDEAMPTVTTRDRHALVCPPFIASQYNGRHAVAEVGGPLPTIPTMKVHYLAQPGALPEIDDCGFRMLEPHEIGAAMAFPTDYVVHGNKEDRIRQFGNAVTPPVLKWIMERVLATLG